MSNSILELLKNAIAEKFHLLVDDENTLCLREEKLEAKCRWVKIKLKNSISSFYFSIDVHRNTGELDPIFPYFNVEYSGLCSKNDAILVCQKEQKTYIFLIELKSTTKGKYLKQLKSSELLLNFIIERINLTSNQELIKKENLEFRGILFWCPRYISEGTTRKKYKVEFEDRKGLLVTEQICHNTYYIQQFLPI